MKTDLHGDNHFDVVVIGGGIAGLTAARKLSSRGLSVAVLEATDHLGGRAGSRRLFDGHSLDIGAQFISSFYNETLDLISELGLTDHLVRRSQGAYLSRGAEIVQIWPAKKLLAGDALNPVAKARLLSLVVLLGIHWRELRIDDLKCGAQLDNLGAQEFLAKRIGREATNSFMSPLLRGLLYWDLPRTNANIVLAILKAFATGHGTYRFNDGMETLSTTLASGSTIYTSTRATSVQRHSGGGHLTTAQHTNSGQGLTLRSKQVVIATTADQALELAPWLPAPTLEVLRAVTYSSTTVLTFQVDRTASGYPPGAVLFEADKVSDIASINPMYPPLETPAAAAVSPLINVCLSKVGHDQTRDLSDADLGAFALKRVKELTDAPWTASAQLAHVQRWARALPEFDAGYVTRLQSLNTPEALPTTMALAGDFMTGPYVDGAVRSGAAAAERLSAGEHGP